MSTYVWYVGPAASRTVSAEKFEQQTGDEHAAVTWNEANDWSVESDFTDGQLGYLRGLGGFVVTEDEGGPTRPADKGTSSADEVEYDNTTSSLAATDVQAAIDELAEAGPGSSAGSPVVRKFPFAFDAAGLLTGHTLWTPAVGDVLLDVWVEIDAAWDGTTPKCDVGQFAGSNHVGWFGSVWDSLDLASPVDSEGNGAGLLSGSLPPLSLLQIVASNATSYSRAVPGPFTTTVPVKVVVSQNGHNNGADPVNTTGGGVVYLVTATPV